MEYQPGSDVKFSLAAQHKEFFCECINAQCVHVHPRKAACVAENATLQQSAQRCRIGVFDSGLGGISVLRKAITRIPSADFLFFGDSAFAPYGSKPCAWVKKRSCEIIEAFIEAQVDAVIIACNTATSVAINYARATYPSLPLFGIEPALKPAVETLSGKRILVMATPVTLKLDRYHALSKKWAHLAQITPVACEGLADRIEQGNFEASDFKALLQHLIGAYAGKIDGVVLGCTHYPFIKKQIRDVLGDVVFFDGSLGTANYVHTRLVQKGLINDTLDMFAAGTSVCDSHITPRAYRVQGIQGLHDMQGVQETQAVQGLYDNTQDVQETRSFQKTQACNTSSAVVSAISPFQHVVSLQTSAPEPEMLKRYELFLTSYFEQ